MKKEDCFELGKVLKAKGLQGELVLFMDTDDPDYYQSLEAIFLDIHANLVPFFIEKIRIHQDKAFVQLEGIEEKDQAQELVGLKVYLPLEALPTLGDNDFYLHQIIDYQVEDIHLGLLGKVNTIYEGTQDLISLYYQNKEVLIPLVDSFLVDVSHEEQKLRLDLPEGLIDLYLQE